MKKTFQQQISQRSSPTKLTTEKKQIIEQTQRLEVQIILQTQQRNPRTEPINMIEEKQTHNHYGAVCICKREIMAW